MIALALTALLMLHPNVLREMFPELPDGRAVLAEAFVRAATPEQELTVSEWADRYRIVAAESGSRFPGPWSTSRVPYLREIMDCLHPDHPARTVTSKASAQSGKTEVPVNWFGFVVDRAPGTMMIVLPSLDEAIKFNRVKLQPAIDSSPQIRHRVKPENSRDEAASTTSFKRYAGGFAQIITASSSKGLQMVSIRYLVMDEVSEYPLDTDGRGSPIEQAERRQKAYGDLAKAYRSSAPGLTGECRITEMYEAGDRRRLYVPCPHCDVFQVLAYENMQAPSETTKNRVTFSCIACGSLIDQIQRSDMLARAQWIPTWVKEGADQVSATIPANQISRWACPPCEGRCRDRQPSYAWWAAYSPFEAWADIWQRGENAKGKPLAWKVFVQQDLGESYDPSADAPEWEKLVAARTDWARGTAPWPACFLTGFIDVQESPARLEWAVWAWGPGCEGWIVDHDVIPHAVETDEAWHEVDQLLGRTFQTANGNPLPVSSWGIDTGYMSPIIHRRAANRHNLRLCKGVSGDRMRQALPCVVKKTKLSNQKGRLLRARPMLLHWIGNFGLKSAIYQGLRNLVGGPDADGHFPVGTLHLPSWVGEDYAKQLTAEVLFDPKTEAKGKSKRAMLERPGDQREWRKLPGRPNEALDIVVGSRALAWLEKIDSWTPEQWAERAASAFRVGEHVPDDLLSYRPPVAATKVAEVSAAKSDKKPAVAAGRRGGVSSFMN